MESLAAPAISVGAARQTETPAFAYFYTVAGRFICVESDDRKSAEMLRHYFSGWHVTPIADARDAPLDATIVVRADETPPSAPQGLEFFEVAAGGICYTDGQTYFFESSGSAIYVAAQNPSRVEVWIGRRVEAQERAELARLVFNASMTAMRRCGLFELHGAGVVEPISGEGVLIVGPSGSGKSTLATQLASAGWKYLSDDTLLIFRNGERVEARGLRRVFAVTTPTVATGVLAGFEELLTEPVSFDPLKVRFEPAKVFPEGFIETSIPRKILFPVISGETKSSARRLSQVETMAQLIKMCPWASYDKPSARMHLGVLSMLARQSKGFELLAGTDLIGNPEYAARFVASIGEGEKL